MEVIVHKTGTVARHSDLARIAEGLEAATELARNLQYASSMGAGFANEQNLTTAADLAVNHCLHDLLLAGGEGWLSEESADDPARLGLRRIWVVDPLDGTKEFVAGIPEWCISIALVEDGEAVAGGISNPATGEAFLGSRETGISLKGKSGAVAPHSKNPAPVVLASRSEFDRGEWDRLRKSSLTVVPMGSVAYKLARVAARLADATWTLVPKHEWDVAAGVALVGAAGGIVKTLQDQPPRFNRPQSLFDGLVAFSAGALDSWPALDEAWR